MSLILALLVALITPNLRADGISEVLADKDQQISDCRSKCSKALSAADKVIKDQQTELDLYKTKDNLEVSQITDLQVQVTEGTSALHAWYHNPFIMIGVGILVGGFAVGYLKK